MQESEGSEQTPENTLGQERSATTTAVATLESRKKPPKEGPADAEEEEDELLGVTWRRDRPSLDSQCLASSGTLRRGSRHTIEPLNGTILPPFATGQQPTKCDGGTDKPRGQQASSESKPYSRNLAKLVLATDFWVGSKRAHGPECQWYKKTSNPDSARALAESSLHGLP